MFYSPSTGGFYSRAIHGDSIPAGAVEITTEEHAALLDGQAQGKIIAADANGYPILVDPPAPSYDEELARKTAEELAWRNEMLRKVIDGLDQIRNDAEFGSTTYKGEYTAIQLNAARVLLCDYPESDGFPFGPRPTMPE